jgi:hypothetical protein
MKNDVMNISGKRSDRLSWRVATGIAILFYVVQSYYCNQVLASANNLFSWDTLGYYIYLPFTFIYHDPGITNQGVIDSIFNTYHPSEVLYQAFQIANGNRMPGYTIGMALLYSPFFFIGHIWALLSNYPADGFSYPYQFCISNGIMVYILAGVFALRKVLLEFFEDKVVAVVLLLICLGTNYWQEVTHGSLGVHPSLFAGYAALCFLLIQWYKTPVWKYSVLLGITGGLLVEIRGSEVLLILPFLLWNVSGWNSLKQRFFFLRRNFAQLIVILLFAILIFVPQFVHWKYVSGDWYFNNYQTAEGFNFYRPNLYNIFFSFKKSLLVYTPVMAFAIAGFVWLFKRNRGLFVPVFLFFLLNTYLLSCWLLWWNATSFGLRYFVQSYVLMALPLSAFIAWCIERTKPVKYLMATLGLFLIFLNVFQTWQTYHKILHPERNTMAYYKAVFLKTKVPDGALKLLEPDRNTAFNGENFDESKFTRRLLGFCNFDDVNTIPVDPVFLDTSFSFTGKYSCILKPGLEFSPTYRFRYSQITSKTFAWLRISLRYYCIEEIKDVPVSIVTHCELDGTGRKVDKYESVDFSTQPSQKNEWNNFVFEYQLPYRFYDDEPVLVYVWYRGQIPVYVDDFKVEAFEPE